MAGVRRAVARAVRAEPQRLAVVSGCPLERQCAALLAHCHDRLEGELLDARADQWSGAE
jgi:hypothetical protein